MISFFQSKSNEQLALYMRTFFCPAKYPYPLALAWKECDMKGNSQKALLTGINFMGSGNNGWSSLRSAQQRKISVILIHKDGLGYGKVLEPGEGLRCFRDIKGDFNDFTTYVLVGYPPS